MAQRFALSALLCLVIFGCSKPVEDTPLAKGTAAFRKGDFDKAIELLTTAIEQNAHDPQAYLYRGQAYITKGSEFSGQAIADYSEAIRLNPDSFES
jgi:tetratricopeptide (TPR) repeat protein